MVLDVRTEEIVGVVYKKLKAMGDIFMAVDQESTVELSGATIWEVGHELFRLGQKLEALVVSDMEDPDVDDDGLDD